MSRRPKLLVILQCPWQKGELANGWNREVWFRELWTSHTGIRLKEALPTEFCEIEICNANPNLAESPDGVFPPDLDHLRTVLTDEQPDLILACGNVAKGAVRELEPPMPVVEMPHPAFRGLSKSVTGEVRQALTLMAVNLR